MIRIHLCIQIELTFEIPPHETWEDTYTKIKEAKTEAEIFKASEDYRNSGRNEVMSIKRTYLHAHTYKPIPI